MIYRAVTVEREYGSGGAEIARLLAAHLGWSLLDHVLIDEVSRRARLTYDEAAALDERLDPWLHRVTRRLWGRGGDGASLISPIELFDAERAAAVTQRVILDAYYAGSCVIVGRGAQCVLHGKPDVFHVYVYADWCDRVDRVRTRVRPAAGIDKLIDDIQRQRFAYVRHHHRENPRDPHLYNLLINSHNDPEGAARLIAAAMYTFAQPCAGDFAVGRRASIRRT